MKLLERRLTELNEAHDSIVRHYAAAGMRCLDRGDTAGAQAWERRIARARAVSEQRALEIRFEES